jgi:predicted aspartyl protease
MQQPDDAEADANLRAMETITSLISKIATFEANEPPLSAVSLCAALTGIAFTNIQRVRTAMNGGQVEHCSLTAQQPPTVASGEI